MLKVSKLQGAPGGSSYAVRFPEGVCPVPQTGLLTEGPLPGHILNDPWLKVEKVWDGTPPGVKAVLATLESEEVARLDRSKKIKEGADKVLDSRSRPGGISVAEGKLRSKLAHLEVRAKSKAKQAGKRPEDWEKFVDGDDWNDTVAALSGETSKADKKKAEKAAEAAAKKAEKAEAAKVKKEAAAAKKKEAAEKKKAKAAAAKAAKKGKK